MRGTGIAAMIAIVLSVLVHTGTVRADTTVEIVRQIDAGREGATPNVRVSVSDGVAVVSGYVSTALEKRAIEARLLDATDLTEVRNLIVLDRP